MCGRIGKTAPAQDAGAGCEYVGCEDLARGEKCELEDRETSV